MKKIISLLTIFVFALTTTAIFFYSSHNDKRTIASVQSEARILGGSPLAFLTFDQLASNLMESYRRVSASTSMYRIFQKAGEKTFLEDPEFYMSITHEAFILDGHGLSKLEYRSLPIVNHLYAIEDLLKLDLPNSFRSLAKERLENKISMASFAKEVALDFDIGLLTPHPEVVAFLLHTDLNPQLGRALFENHRFIKEPGLLIHYLQYNMKLDGFHHLFRPTPERFYLAPLMRSLLKGKEGLKIAEELLTLPDLTWLSHSPEILIYLMPEHLDIKDPGYEKKLATLIELPVWKNHPALFEFLKWKKPSLQVLRLSIKEMENENAARKLSAIYKNHKEKYEAKIHLNFKNLFSHNRVHLGWGDHPNLMDKLSPLKDDEMKRYLFKLMQTRRDLFMPHFMKPFEAWNKNEIKTDDFLFQVAKNAPPTNLHFLFKLEGRTEELFDQLKEWNRFKEDPMLFYYYLVSGGRDGDYISKWLADDITEILASGKPAPSAFSQEERVIATMIEERPARELLSFFSSPASLSYHEHFLRAIEKLRYSSSVDDFKAMDKMLQAPHWKKHPVIKRIVSSSVFSRSEFSTKSILESATKKGGMEKVIFEESLYKPTFFKTCLEAVRSFF